MSAHVNIDMSGLFPEGYSYKRLCSNCGKTWGDHKYGDDLCPSEDDGVHSQRSRWDNSPGTHFKDSGVDALPKGYVE